MNARVSQVRGMPTLLPCDQRRHTENRLQQLLAAFNYTEIRPPLVEKTELFTRSIGDQTQLVEKEMFSFADRHDVSMSLRPEATAGIVRFCIDQGLLTEHRLWHLGPMFRYERPQSGRSRQFDQLDVEIIGAAAPAFDAELIWLSACFWQALNITNPPVLHINALGDQHCRQQYNQALRSFLNQHKAELDDDSQARLDKNPLRILDSKIAQTRALLTDAPQLSDYWDDATKRHLDDTCKLLDVLGINYQQDLLLVRGLDYYDKLVFEWISDDLGAQNTVCAGGRYDGLVEQLGGKPTPASGFALGMERLLLMMAEHDSPKVDLFLTNLISIEELLKLRQRLLEQLPQLKVAYSLSPSSLKSQLRKAHSYQSRFVLIVGEDEVAQQSFLLRDMANSQQQSLSWSTLCNQLAKLQKSLN